ncbi:MAG: DivIVA domain-containing protein [Acidimicrobiia bacterium]|nr:DivIVA domain-containing protein [Acidimicrobiia bacterium]
MAEQPKSRSLRDYASFELERKGYDRAQVDAFLNELDQAFVELEASVKERGREVAELQVEVERLKRESPRGRTEEILKRAEANAEQMLASSLAEGQEIIAKAEAMSMRIIANARAQSQELAAQPPGFGMLARVRTVAADIDRIRTEHAALMEEQPELLAPDEELITFGDEAAVAEAEEAAEGEAPAIKPKKSTAAKKPAAKKPAAKKPAAKKPATKASTKAELATVEDAEEELIEAKLPRIKLVEPPPVVDEPEEAPVEETPSQEIAEIDVESEVEAEDEYDDVMLDPKDIDWGAARQEVIEALGVEDQVDTDDAVDEAEEPELDEETAAVAVAAREKLPTIMRREGSRYERHSASLPKIGSEGESTLSDVSKVSKRRRRRAAYRDDEAL